MKILRFTVGGVGATLLTALLAACAASIHQGTIPSVYSDFRAGSTDWKAFSQNTSASISGVLYQHEGTIPIMGAEIIVGSFPDTNTCRGWSGCGHPIAPLHQVRTDAKGRFTIKNVPTGDSFLQISKDGYAELHQVVHPGGPHLDLGDVEIVKLRPVEIAWLADVNAKRRNFAIPSTPGNLVIDEFAQVSVRKFENEIADGKKPYNDPTYEAPKVSLTTYNSSYGATAVADLNMTADGADQAWFSERKNCKHRDWRTCKFEDDTGHYINLANSANVWIGLGVSEHPLKKGLQWAGYYAYGGIEIVGGIGGYKYSSLDDMLHLTPMVPRGT